MALIDSYKLQYKVGARRIGLSLEIETNSANISIFWLSSCFRISGITASMHCRVTLSVIQIEIYDGLQKGTNWIQISSFAWFCPSVATPHAPKNVSVVETGLFHAQLTWLPGELSSSISFYLLFLLFLLLFPIIIFLLLTFLFLFLLLFFSSFKIRPRISLKGSVRPSVCLYVRPSVCPLPCPGGQ